MTGDAGGEGAGSEGAGGEGAGDEGAGDAFAGDSEGGMPAVAPSSGPSSGHASNGNFGEWNSNLRAAVSIKLMVPSIVALAQSGTEAIALSLTTALSEAAARIAMVSGSARYRRHRIAMVTNITSAIGWKIPSQNSNTVQVYKQQHKK